VDLANWPNVKVMNTYADEEIWTAGCTVKMILKLNTDCGDLFCTAFGKLFEKMTGIDPSEQLVLSGSLLSLNEGNDNVKLTSVIPEINLSDELML
jgi:hypothetical protein